MIQLNLLPTIKAEYVKAERTKRTVIVLSVIVSITSLGIVGLLASVAYGAQKLQLSNLNNEIQKSSTELEQVQDLDKILTIQNQLNALTPLHDAKPVMSRLFTYIQQTTPESVSIDTLKVNNTDFTWNIEGKAPTFELINKYVDTLKFTEIKQSDPNAEKIYAFKEVVLADFTKNTGGEVGYTYTITLKFNDQLFSSANPDIQLVVPSATTTRSQTQLPSEGIFAPNPESEVQQ
jgi:Tfp pilus assembly protein PilN